MALAEEATDTQTATVTTEHDFGATTDSNVRALMVELDNMVAGDIVELRIYVKDEVVGTDGEAWKATYANAQAAIHAISPPVPMPFGGKFSLKQTAGTSRDFDWHVYTVE